MRLQYSKEEPTFSDAESVRRAGAGPVNYAKQPASEPDARECLLPCAVLHSIACLGWRRQPRTPRRRLWIPTSYITLRGSFDVFTFRNTLQTLTMGDKSGPQPPYPLHPSVVPRLAPDYAAFYNQHIIDKQQVHLQSLEASRQSGTLIPGSGPKYPVAKTEDFSFPRKESSGPDLKVRCFTPQGKQPDKGWPCLIYYHGGGWVLGNIDTENVIATNLCGRANCVVVNVDYRSVSPVSPPPSPPPTHTPGADTYLAGLLPRILSLPQSKTRGKACYGQ